MKKFLITLILALTLISSNMAYAAVIPTEVELNQNITITYNGKVQRFKNVKGDIVYPISYEGTTYLPIRSISCLFETEIEWDGNTNSIHLGKGTLDTIAAEAVSEFIPGTNQNIIVDLNQDIKIYHNNEVQTFKDVNGKVVYPLSYQGTTYLPVRAISNLYDAKIEWIGETSTVVINKKNSSELEVDVSLSGDNVTKVEYDKLYKEVTVKEFKEIAIKNGYYFLDDEVYENWPEEYKMPEVISDFIMGFAVDENSALEYKIEFYEFKNSEEIELYYEQCIERFRTWNDEEKTINEESGKNYKKCEIINQYGYGIVINVENTLFAAYGYKDELKKLIIDLYE